MVDLFSIGSQIGIRSIFGANRAIGWSFRCFVEAECRLICRSAGCFELTINLFNKEERPNLSLYGLCRICTRPTWSRKRDTWRPKFTSGRLFRTEEVLLLGRRRNSEYHN